MTHVIRRTARLTRCLYLLGVGAILTVVVALPAPTYAADAKEIDAEVDLALKEFQEKMVGSDEFFKIAKGVLVFPAVYKAGLFIGGEYGNGALRIGGKSVGYYNLASASIGFQIGAQKTSLILMFMKDAVLERFQASTGFELGVDAGVTLVTVGAGTSFDTTKAGEPILAFVFDEKGLMAGVSLKGAKFTKLDIKK